MTDERFWQLIEQHVVVSADLEVDPGPLEDALAILPEEEILAFDEAFTRHYCRSYSWSLWGAAYLINGGCSDDGFDYFRGWLIARGRTIFEQALADPDSLVEHCAEGVECEDMLYVAGGAYETATGHEMPVRSYRYPEIGKGFDFDDAEEMRKRYPRLAAAF